MARWLELLADFEFELIYRSGPTNHAADILSRLNCEAEDEDRTESSKKEIIINAVVGLISILSRKYRMTDQE